MLRNSKRNGHTNLMIWYKKTDIDTCTSWFGCFTGRVPFLQKDTSTTSITTTGALHSTPLYWGSSSCKIIPQNTHTGSSFFFSRGVTMWTSEEWEGIVERWKEEESIRRSFSLLTSITDWGMLDSILFCGLFRKILACSGDIPETFLMGINPDASLCSVISPSTQEPLRL